MGFPLSIVFLSKALLGEGGCGTSSDVAFLPSESSLTESSTAEFHGSTTMKSVLQIHQNSITYYCAAVIMSKIWD
ncbi:hypothetical protein J437_LFUL005271 [Ladona fulva]|uniref:Uncharacterized protein n=1 Tax=Ladona fulva TaxID=123851 RepID=A0A8K0PA36_LADFU|nr:hypothetical protein J437_LFUL005271 [Ladona fulva]